MIDIPTNDADLVRIARSLLGGTIRARDNAPVDQLLKRDHTIHSVHTRANFRLQGPETYTWSIVAQGPMGTISITQDMQRADYVITSLRG